MYKRQANARHPENAMEYSKRVAEIYVHSSDCRLKRDKGETDMFIVRLGEVYPTNTHCLITDVYKRQALMSSSAG